MALRLFFAGMIGLILFIGCGGGGGGGGGSGLLPAGPVTVSGTLSGTIQIDQAISALRSDVSSFSPNLRFLDSFVMIEELSNVSTRADENGKFIFENIPFGTYHIIARVTSLAGRVYKIRTQAQAINQPSPLKDVTLNIMQPDLAEHQIRMQIKDLNGNPVGKCKVWFWGEQFTLDANGYYVSPNMPATAAGTIKVEPPVDKELSKLEFNIPATTFNPDNLEILGITLPTAGISNKAPIVSITTEKYPESGSAFLRLYGNYSDPEGEPMTTRWLTNVSTFSYVAKDYADWAVPSISASVTVYFSASEDGRFYPRLTSIANLSINVASSGDVSFPGEILLRPVTRSVDIVGSSTAQIPGNTVAMYEAKTNFPPGLALSYFWTVNRGTMLSSSTESILNWRSPTLSPGATQVASITLAVTDGIGTASKEIQVRITSVPTVTINKPTATAFEPGLIVFTGIARDYLNTAISPDSMRWYVATGTAAVVLSQTGGATFTWQFMSQGSYTVALEAFDANGVTGTGTKNIAIINGRPVCAITQPANDASYLANTPITFVGTANDSEDGLITDAIALTWTSDIDGVIGSGTTFTVASLTSSRHEISFAAVDSGGAVGSTSIIVWYDVPARIAFTPANLSVFFEGYNIPFAAVGTDTDNTSLDSAQFKWYLNNLPDIWREGADFTITAGAYVPGANRVRVEGPAQYETAVSSTHVIQMGWPVASITSPASGTRFEPAAIIPFVAVPDSTGTLSLQWYLNNDPISFGSGANVSYSPSNGAHRVTYVGIDSQGVVSSSTINIVVERVPQLVFSPGAGSYIFTGHPINFAATCIDTNNNDIADDKVSWLLNGSPWLLASGKNFSIAQPAQLSSGTYQVTLIATGPYGTSNSVANTIRTGVSAAKINLPANNQTFSTGTNITFNGIPDSGGAILMEWWANLGLPGATKIGDGATVNTSALPDGYNEITYLGTDSTGFVSSHSIRIGIGEFPEMDFTPAEGTVFFGSQDVVFTGVGTDSVDGTVPGSRMAWYIDGALELASYSVLTITPARISVLGTGLKEVELRGYNTLGAAGTTIKKFYLGVPVAAIASPSVSDTVIPTSTLCDFSAVPDNIDGPEITEPLEMQWWLNYHLPTRSQFPTTGSALTATLPDGNQYLTYIGTDSQGVVSQATIRVIVSDSPAISFTPSDGARLFVGQPFNLEASAVVVATSVVWSLDGGITTWQNESPYTVVPGDLAVGLNNITAVGENDFGVAASITNAIYYGVALASITAPASGSEYLRGTGIDLAGSPSSVGPIVMRWYRDDGSGAVYMGNTANLAGYPMPEGRQTITYVGTDSAGFVSSATIQILMNDPPPMEIIPGNGSIFFAGRSVSFVGSGTAVISGLPVASPTMNWYLDGASSKTSSPITYNTLEQVAGIHSLQVAGADSYNTVGTSTAITIKFGQTVASITAPASGSRYDVGDSITFTGQPDSEGLITMEWYRDGVLAAFDDGANPAAQIFPAGLHTIRYIGTDSANFCSSATIQLLVNDVPTMQVMPGNSSIFFAGRPVTFTGSGTTSTGNTVATATMKWYIDGSTTAISVGSPYTLAATALSAGPHSIKLEGVDEYGVKGADTINFEFRYPVAGISSPASGTTYASGTAVPFSGTVDSHPDMQFQWWYDIGTGGATQMGVGQNIAYSVPYGLRTITYLATDSSGFVSSATIQILMNDQPNMLILPGTGGIFFANQPVTVYGYGTSAVSLSLNPATFKWYADGVLKSAFNGQSNPTFGSTELAAGSHDIMLLGSDIYGTAGTTTVNLKFRQTVASIVLPASGTLYDPLLDTINFTGNPGTELPIAMQWHLNNAALSFGTDATSVLNPPLVPNMNVGWNTITYLGTDSASFCSSATIQLLVNRPPTMDFTPGDGSMFFTGRPITLIGSGTSYSGAAIASATMKWFVNGVQKTTNSPAILNVAWLNTGFNNICISGTDNYGTVGAATYSIYYGYPLTSITAPASGAIYPLVNNINFTAAPAASLPEIAPIWQLNGAYFASGNAANIVNLAAGLHTVTYLASDSSGFVSSSTIQLLVNDTPNLIFTPGEDSVFFTGRPVTFVGEGTSTANVSVATSTMKWYLNGSSTALKTGSPVTFIVNQLLSASNTIKLTGVDEFAVAGEVTCYNVSYGVQTANITYPASGTTLPVATNASFTAVPAQILPGFTTRWYHETGAGSPANLGSGNSITGIPLAAGWHTIRYLATDSSGFVSSATIMLLKNDAPVLTVLPASNSVFFSGRPVTLTGYGTDSANVAINPATMKWYVNGGSTPLQTGSPATFNVGQLSVGNNVIRLTAADSYGTVGEVFCNITYGYPLSSITSPASGTVNPVGTPIDFAGNPPSAGLNLVMEWWRDDGILAPFHMGDSSILSNITVPAGRHTITYLGTDSANFCSSSTIQILLNNTPTITFAPPADGVSAAVIFTGKGFTLEATGTPVVDNATFRWYKDGSTSVWKNLSPITVNAGELTAGWHDVYGSGADAYGTRGTGTHQIYYEHPLPSISTPASGTPFARGSSPAFTGSAVFAGVDVRWYLNTIDTGNITQNYSAVIPDGWNTVSYHATDSAGNLSSASIMVLMNDPPTLTFTPAANSVVFTGRSFKLEATGTESIPPNPFINNAGMKWYRDAVTSTFKTVSPATVNAGDLTVGLHTLYVAGPDQYGTVGTSSVQGIYYGHPLLTIASPTSGIRIDTAVNPVLFEGSLASSAISLSWYLNSTPVAGTANTNSIVLGNGLNTIEYVGIDSVGNISTATVTVLKSNSPTITFTPASNSVIFAGGNFVLEATGTEAVPPPVNIDPTTFKWYKDAITSVWQNGSPVPISSLTVGTHTLYVSGVDQFGIVGTSSVQAIYYGHPVASITWPASGTRFDLGSAPTFTGSAASAGINLRWYLDGADTGVLTQNYTPAPLVPAPAGWRKISYHATDTVGNLSTASITVLIDSLPTMNFTPGDGSRFFTTTNVTFTGTGVGGDGTFYAIPGTNMNWYLDGAGAATRPATSTAYFSSGQLTTNNHTLKLQGTDQYGIASSTTLSFYYGHPLAAISSPASGTRFNIASNVSLIGTPDSAGPITMKWYKDYGLPSVADLVVTGSGPHTVSFLVADRGIRSITYIGTDTANFVSSKTVQILLDTPPAMTIASPTAGGKYFGGQSLYFEGSGVNSSATPEVIPGASVTWYIDGVPKATGLTYTAPVNELPTGTRNIRIEGKDEFGTIGSTTHTIQTGLNLPTITSPLSGAKFTQSEAVSFIGSADQTGNMTWYSDDQVPPIGAGASLAINTSILMRGWRTITYIGTDSAGTSKSASISILIDSAPTFATPATVTAPLPFASGPEYGSPGNKIPIHLVTLGNYGLTLDASAIDGALSPILPASLTWYVGATVISNVPPVTYNFNTPGSYTIRVAATDEFGITATSTLVIWVWETENYPGFTTSPASILMKSTSELIVADPGVNSVLKLTRSTTTIETTRGDITGVATQTDAIPLVGHTLVDFTIAGTSIYTLSSIANTSHLFTEWDSNFTYVSSFTILDGAGPLQLADPKGLSVDTGNAFYVSDTGNSLVKKMDLAGTSFLSSQFVNQPVGISVDGSNVYVAASGTNQLKKFTSALNTVATWNSSASANNATHFVVGATSKNLYVTDPEGSSINVIASSGTLLYTFGTAANFQEPYGITIVGTTDADMYVTDRLGNKIVRFRTNSW
ncbi:MAG: NHL repeat-containing protein [Candidatus Riflebacteria bacterium]|nr:NHL repeat-containing protein [Candidatus Riflebacteria bacterium]